ncbi:ClpXP protease specificity-enhancing factor [Rhodoferax koreensis]|nr:ClpXP protease specificity-enhancing factor [Rhodoferax koreense]
MNALDSTSTRPYLIRALYEWCTDNGFTPYVAVLVDDTVQVPREYVKDGEIVLNISFDATSSLNLGNEFIEFKARFAGTAREIQVPVSRVIAIYARENGQGMAFPSPVAATSSEEPTKAALTSVPGSASPAADKDVKEAKTGPKVVPLGQADEPVGGGEPPEPPRPKTSGPRPALKRIK